MRRDGNRIAELKATILSVQAALAECRERGRQQSLRLDSLWHLVNTPTLRGEELVRAMLREAASAIRPGQTYAGALGHIEGFEYVLDAVAGLRSSDNATIGRSLHPGMRTPVVETLLARDLSAGRTQSWEDCLDIPDLPEAARKAGLRSQIATQFTANGTIYVLTLASLDPPSVTAFGPEDYEYVEVLGAFFLHHIAQGRMEDTLRRAESRARYHAERLEGLWQIENDRELRGTQRMHAMLHRAAATIHPDQRFSGVLGRVEGGKIVVISVGAEPDADGSPGVPLKIGSSTPLDQTYVDTIKRTRCWEDAAVAADAPHGASNLGWRAIISTQFEAGGSWYSLSFGSPEPAIMSFGPDDVAYLGVLSASFANQLEVDRLENSLRDEEERSRQHADRLEALRRIINNPELHDHELVNAMLAQAATSIRPGDTYRGTLWLITEDTLIVEALAPAPGTNNAFPAVGSRVPRSQSIIGTVISEGRGTRSWDDLQTSIHVSALERNLGTRSLIITTFTAGAATWALSFGSLQSSSEPLGPQDYAYVEVVAAFFANHIQQRWQFDRIAYQQSHDVLTGLLSRSHFRSRARSAAARDTGYAIILVNVDAFREINETRGHVIGDAVLVEVGDALQKRTLPGEIAGRIGGDVFGIYIPNPSSTAAVESRALDFLDVFSTAFSTGDRRGSDFISRTGTLGIAVAPGDGEHIDAILSHAGAALLHAKQRGPSSIVFYAAGMEGDAMRSATLRNELAAAIARDEFELYYQPKVEIATGNVTGCEALIRWNHPTRGLLLPGEFIPFAEHNGIIGSIDNWVMHETFARVKDVVALRPGFRLYFNLSGRQAGDSSVIRAFATAARNAVPLANIGVEITESDAMRDVEATRRVCRALRRFNVRIAIDDFGTGYSSLSSLKRLPVDIVKIDRSFISGILNDLHDETIAETIISIAKNFGLDALAEGVEQQAEVEWLRRHGCRYMQGYAICRPLPLAEFMAWLSEHPQHDRPALAGRTGPGFAELIAGS